MNCNSCTSSYCVSEGNEKLSVYNWLSDIISPSPNNVVEVRFKNSRKAFYQNINKLSLKVGDVVTVESLSGHDIGTISLVGELVKLQMNEKKQAKDQSILKIYRKATKKDIETWEKAKSREWDTMMESRKITERLKLNMKLSDIEYQGDNSKAVFYYTAEDRVDFRVLIKELASRFSIRVEMKQIGFRQEAARVGGIGSCGRELCCSTWLTDFSSVSTSAARYQQLSLNPQKLAGQCGKLKCCLNYELDSYLDALEGFPNTETELITTKGKAYFQKLDVFKKIAWYSYIDKPMFWYPLDIKDVIFIIKENEAGKTADELGIFLTAPVSSDFHEVVGQDDLNRFDQTKKRRPKNRNQQQRSPESTQGIKAKQEVKNIKPKALLENKPLPNKPTQGNKKPNDNQANFNRNKRRNPNKNKDEKS